MKWQTEADWWTGHVYPIESERGQDSEAPSDQAFTSSRQRTVG